MRQSCQGFSLMEMAVVLAIIGLLVGGVMVGLSMQQTSRLQQVIVDTTGYMNAMQQFREQYGELPGDYATAARVWGEADGTATPNTVCTGALGAILAASPKATCNGDGNGRIHGAEQFRAYQQMSNAGLIAGFYNGISDTIYHNIPNYNSPVGALKGTTYAISSYGPYASDSVYWDGDYPNALQFGKATSNTPNANALKPNEAYDIDVKTDDGRPGMGLVRTYKGSVGTSSPGPHAYGRSCAGQGGSNSLDGTDPVTAEYRRSNNSILCILVFMYGYGFKTTDVTR